MKLTKFLKGIMTLTVLSVIYINLQVQIYDLAYQGKRREKEINKLTDSNGNVIYNICKLKSANNLGGKLLDENSDMRFLDDKSIVKLETRIPAHRAAAVSSPQNNEEKRSNILTGLFTLRSQAEAKQ